MKMLLKLKDQAEIVIVINASDIEKNKVRGDLGITYDVDVLRLIDAFREYGLYVGSVVIRPGGPASLRRKNSSAACRASASGPTGITASRITPRISASSSRKRALVEMIISRRTRPVVVVTAPGPGSGKMATCLSQLYHEHKRGIQAGYAKYETFPIWNLPLKHPVNLAYEAATVDLADVNMIDPFHLEAYGETAVNYNRDVEIFPVLERDVPPDPRPVPLQEPARIWASIWRATAIVDDEVCCEASRQEIIRRYYASACAVRKGKADGSETQKLEVLMRSSGIAPQMRRTVPAALDRAAETGGPATAIELEDGTVVTGKTSELLGASAAALLNALKTLAKINHEIKLISPSVLAPIQALKTEHLGSRNPRLHSDEVLMALSFSAVTNPVAALALEQLDRLRSCQAHASVILSPVDVGIYKKLGINLTQEPVYQTSRLYHK